MQYTDAAQMGWAMDLASIRSGAFRDASAAMIAIGKTVGLPEEAKAIQIFRCPMANADWLQPAGATSNPFYGTSMISCGAAVESLPKASPASTAAATRPATQQTTKLLAIPRSAVI